MSTSLKYLRRVGNRQKFFRLVGDIFPKSDWRYKKINLAYQTVEAAFRLKYRKTGEEYIEHLLRSAIIMMLADNVRSHILICAVLLHDIVEDCSDRWSVERVQLRFGKRIAMLVYWMTNGSDEKVNHQKLKMAPRSLFRVRLSERIDNLRTIWGCSLEKIIAKIAETEDVYQQYAKKHRVLERELAIAINMAKMFARQIERMGKCR